MQNNTPRLPPAERARRWLLSRPHVSEPSSRDRGASGIFPGNADELVRALVLAALGWSLSQGTLLFSVNPLAPAFLCALPSGIPYALAGAVLGTLTGGYDRPLLLTGLVCAVLVRSLLQLSSLNKERKADNERTSLRKALFRNTWQHLSGLCTLGKESDENAPQASLPGADKAISIPFAELPSATRVLTSLLSTMLPATLLLIRGGFAFYDLYGALLMLLLSPVATLLFCYALADPTRAVSPVKRAIGAATLLFFVCFCLRTVRLPGLMPAVVLLLFLSLLCVHRNGLLAALGIVLIGGVAISHACLVPLGATVLLYAATHRTLGRIALLTALTAGITCTLATGGATLFSALAPSIAVSVLLFSVRCAVQQKRRQSAYRQATDYRHNALHNELCAERARSAALLARLSAVAGAFSGLCEVFLRLGEHMQHPTQGELRRLCDSCFDRYCPTCEHKDACWTKEYTQTLPAIDRLTDALMQGQRADEELLDRGMRERCPHKSMLLGDINYTYAHRMYEQRRGALTERFAHDCSITAALLRDVIAEDRLAPGSDDEQAAALGRALRREGFSFESVSVFGGERYTAVIEGCGALDADGVNKLHDVAQRISGRTLSVPHYDEDANGCYRLQAIPRIQARGVFRSLAACNSINEPQGADSHSAVCGDSMRLFSDGSGAYYALLCDGMGSGASAALTSGCCVMLLERLLRAGVGIDTAMGLLNHYLISRTDSPEREITSTVDLLALDLYGEKAKFIKSGAADTLILRRGMLYSVSCHTLPLGILQTLDVQAVPFALEDGDCIFMMSDGVTEPSDGQNEQACERLYELLTAAPPPRDDTAATALLEHILAQARATGAKDDLTVALIRIESQ